LSLTAVTGVLHPGDVAGASCSSRRAS